MSMEKYEEKNYKLTEQFNGLQGVNFVKDDCADVDTYYTVDGTVDLLNEFAEENEQLKSKNRGLQSELQIFKEDATHSNLQINKLADENDKLKSRVEYLERKIDRERTSYQKQHEKWEEEIQKENEQLKKVFRELITSGYWDDDYLTEQDWNDLKRYIENVFEKVMLND